MKKIGILLLCLVGVLALIYLSAATIIKTGIEKAATRALGTGVTISSLHLSPFSGHASLNNLRIMNPEGFSRQPLMSFGLISVSMDLKTILSSQVNIHHIQIDSPTILMEMNESGNNLRRFQNNLQERQKTQTEKSSNENAKNVQIDLLRMTNAILTTNIAGQDVAKVTVRDLEIKDIGNNRSVTMQQAFQIIVDAIMRDAIRASTGLSIKSTVEGVLDRAGEAGGAVGRSIRGFFE